MADPTLYLSQNPRRWYLVPAGASPPQGALLLRTLRGQRLMTTAEAAAAWEVPEARGRPMEEALRAEMAEDGARLLQKLSGYASGATDVATALRDAAHGRTTPSGPAPSLAEALDALTPATPGDPAWVGDLLMELLLGASLLAAELTEGQGEARLERLTRGLAAFGVPAEQVRAAVVHLQTAVQAARPSAEQAAAQADQAQATAQIEAAGDAALAFLTAVQAPADGAPQPVRGAIWPAAQAAWTDPAGAGDWTRGGLGAFFGALTDLRGADPAAQAQARGRLSAGLAALEAQGATDAARVLRDLLAKTTAQSASP